MNLKVIKQIIIEMNRKIAYESLCIMYEFRKTHEIKNNICSTDEAFAHFNYLSWYNNVCFTRKITINHTNHHKIFQRS